MNRNGHGNTLCIADGLLFLVVHTPMVIVRKENSNPECRIIAVGS
jgi:hypothetical protein